VPSQIINAYLFHTMKRDGKHKTQNSGVTTISWTSKDEIKTHDPITYYGAIEDIFELDLLAQRDAI